MTLCLFALSVAAAVVWMPNVTAQPLKRNTTPQAYVEGVGGGAQVVPAGELTIDGKKVSCKKWPTVLDPNLDDFAVSYPGFIILRPDVIATVTTTVALWIYYHECGHLHGIKDETIADCFSIKLGRQEKWLNGQGLEEVCAFISKGRADNAHFSGSERCAAMRQCFQQPSGSAKRQATGAQARPAKGGP